MPEDFRGGVVIFYGEKDGVELENENSALVYRIPKSGVLRLQDEPVLGPVKTFYYFEKAGGERKTIPYLQVTGDRNPDGTLRKSRFGDISQQEIKEKVFAMHAGGVAVFEHEGREWKYTSFIVSTPAESEEYFRELQVRIDELSFGPSPLIR